MKYAIGDIIQWKTEMAVTAEVTAIKNEIYYYRFLTHYTKAYIGKSMSYGCPGVDHDTFLFKKKIDVAKIWREALNEKY